LQNAVTEVEGAISLATQGATTTATAATRATLAQQVAGIQQALVAISQTQVNGHYIFSGDQDTGPAYQLDPTQANGVAQLINSPATRVILDPTGTAITVAKTAQQIFDTGTSAQGNVFAAVNDLLTALQNNDTPGITTAASSLKAADKYLNDQIAFYGEAQDRVQAASDLAQKFQTQDASNLSDLRDADIPGEAIKLSQAQVNQQAALSVEAKITQNKNLFDYLG
jgi:flagellar hook-associated protein 3 FlgL